MDKPSDDDLKRVSQPLDIEGHIAALQKIQNKWEDRFPEDMAMTEARLAREYDLSGTNAVKLLKTCQGNMRIARHMATMTLWGISGERVVRAAAALMQKEHRNKENSRRTR